MSTAKNWQALKYSSVGIELAISVLLGYFAGDWLDGEFGWSPWGAVLGLSFGFAAGLRSLYRLSQKISREAKRDSSDDAQ